MFFQFKFKTQSFYLASWILLYIFFLYVVLDSLSFLKISLFGCTRSHLQHVGSLVAESSVEACEPLVATCEIQFPDQGLNPGPPCHIGSLESQPLDHQGNHQLRLLLFVSQLEVGAHMPSPSSSPQIVSYRCLLSISPFPDLHVCFHLGSRAGGARPGGPRVQVGN